MATQDNGPSRHEATVAQAGSSLACFSAGGSATRLYYLGVDNAVNVLGCGGRRLGSRHARPRGGTE